jgi:hypothetical protein
VFLYTTNQLLKKEKNPLYNFYKTLKYLGVNLTKEGKDLYIENYRTLMKQTEENTGTWNELCVGGLE